jgi:Spy/CpxP family protein refolding chaperone
MRKATLSIIVALAAVALGAGVFVGCKHHGHGHMTPERMKKMVSWVVDDILDDLDATEVQEEQVNAIKERLLTEGIKVHEENRRLAWQMLEEWNKEQPNMERVHQLVDESAENKRAFAHKLADGAQELHGILTLEQRKELYELVEEHFGDHR